jgi:hypothetical protein
VARGPRGRGNGGGVELPGQLGHCLEAALTIFAANLGKRLKLNNIVHHMKGVPPLKVRQQSCLFTICAAQLARAHNG